MAEDEADLVWRAQAGDRAAFGELTERHQRTVFRFLVGYVADHHAAEELTQETLLRAFRRIRDLEEADRARAWFVAIARNLARRWLRRRRPAPEPLEADTPALAPDPAPDERAATAMRALALLRPADREVLVLFELEGLSHARIAAITGDSESALRNRLMRARRRLRAIVEKMERESHYGER